MTLHLQAHIGAHRHADGYSERKPANALGDFGGGQNIARQRHGGGAAHRVHRAHIQTDDNERAEQGEGQECREGQAEQRQEHRIDPVAVEVVQQISGHRAEEDGGHRHGGKHNTHLGTGNADLLAVDGDDGDGRIKRGQNQQVCYEQQNEPPVPDFLTRIHGKAPLRKI